MMRLPIAPHSWKYWVFVHSFNFRHSGAYMVVSYCSLIFISLMNNDTESFSIWISSFMTCLFKYFVHFSTCSVQFSLVAQSCPTLWSHERQHARPPSITSSQRPPKPMSSSRWCHPTISSPVIPFSSCPQSFPASESFQVSQLFTSGGQSIGVSASTSVLPMNTQDWSPLGWTGWISCSPKDSQELPPTPQFKNINSLVLSFL